MSPSGDVRSRLLARIDGVCVTCGSATGTPPITVADAARASGVGRKVIRRLIGGRNIWSSHLDMLDTWLRS